MARISTGYTFGLNKKEALAARMLAEGKKTREIAIILFDCLADDGSLQADEHKVVNAMGRVRKMYRKPGFQECFREIVKEAIMPDYARAVSVISKQLDDGNGWLANKAANDILTRFGAAIMGEDDKQVTVRIEGMPTLGVPESQDALPEPESSN